MVALLVANGRSPVKFPEVVTKPKKGGKDAAAAAQSMRVHRKEMIKHKEILLQLRELQPNMSFTQKVLARCLYKALPDGSEQWPTKLDQQLQ